MEEPKDRLKRLRIKAGFKSPRACAIEKGWNENTYKAVEGGMRDMTRATAQKFAAGFGVSWFWLLYGYGKDGPAMKPEEMDLVERYREADPVTQANILAILDQRGRTDS